MSPGIPLPASSRASLFGQRDPSLLGGSSWRQAGMGWRAEKPHSWSLVRTLLHPHSLTSEPVSAAEATRVLALWSLTWICLQTLSIITWARRDGDKKKKNHRPRPCPSYTMTDSRWGCGRLFTELDAVVCSPAPRTPFPASGRFHTWTIWNRSALHTRKWAIPVPSAGHQDVATESSDQGRHTGGTETTALECNDDFSLDFTTRA